MDLRVRENLVKRAGRLGLGELGPEGLDLLRIGVPDPLEGRAGLGESVGNPVDMPVVEPDGRHYEFTRFYDRMRLPLGGVVRAICLLEISIGKRLGKKGARGHRGCGRGEELAAIHTDGC